MAKNLISGPDLNRLTQIWVPKIFFVGFTSTRCLTLSQVTSICKEKFQSFKISNGPNSRKWQKESFWAWFRPAGTKFEPPIFFFSNMASSVTRYYGQISSCTISEKTNDSIFGKFSERRTDKLIDRQKDESNFIWRFPTNVDRAITILMCYMDDWSIFYSLLLSLIYKTYLHKSKTYIQK